MGLLDRIRSTVASTVNTARAAATSTVNTARATANAGVAAVRAEARTVVHQADHYAGVIADRARDSFGPAHPARQDFANSIGSAFARTDQAIRQTVNNTAQAVSHSVNTAHQAVNTAATAVQNAGRQVINSGAAISHAVERSTDDVRRIAGDAGRIVGDAGHVVVDAGRAAGHAATAALTGDPRELEAAHASIGQARAHVADAHRAVSDAHDRAVDIGTQGQNVVGALRDARTSLETARDRLGDAGGAIRNAVHEAVTAPRRILEGVTTAVEQGGQQVRDAIARDVPGGREMLAGADHFVHGFGELATGVARADPFQVARGLTEGAQGQAQFNLGAWHAASPAVEYAQNAVTGYAHHFDVAGQVGELQPGESVRVNAGANAHVEIGGEANGHITATRDADGRGYTLEAGGAAGINGYLHGGGRVNLGFANGSAGAEASAHALAGSNVEYHFATQAEATRGANILQSLAAEAAASGTAGAAVGAAGPIASTVVSAAVASVMGPSDEDLRFLRDHTSAIELNGTVSAEAAASLGLDRGVLTAGIGLSGSVEATHAVRIEMEHGRATGASVRTTLQGEVAGHVGVGVQWPQANASPTAQQANVQRGPDGAALPAAPDPTREPNGLPPTQLSGTLQGRVVIENHYALPAGVTGAQFQADPVGTLRAHAAEMERTHTASATVSLEAGGDLAGRFGAQGTGRGWEATLRGNVQAVSNPEVLRLAASGDFAGAARRADQLDPSHSAVRMEGREFDIRSDTHGVDDLGGDIVGVGISGTFQAERRQETTRRRFEMTGPEIVETGGAVVDRLRNRGVIRG